MILEDLRFAWNGKDHGSKEMALWWLWCRRCFLWETRKSRLVKMMQKVLASEAPIPTERWRNGNPNISQLFHTATRGSLVNSFWFVRMFLIFFDLSSKSKNLWWINESWDAADPCAFDFLSPWHRWSSLIIAGHRSQSGFDIQMCGFGRMSVYHGVNECAMHETKRLETGRNLWLVTWCLEDHRSKSAGTAPCRRWPKPTRSSRASHVFWTGWVTDFEWWGVPKWRLPQVMGFRY